MTTTNSRQYPAYEESGVEWVGETPAGWEIQPFFVHASKCKRSNNGMVNNNLLSLSFGRVIRKDIEASDGLLPASFETYQVVEPNDVVFRLTDLQNDKRSLRSAICRERGIITSAYLAVQPVGIEPSYLAYLMRSYDLTKVFYALGSGLRQSLKYSDMKRLPLLVPSLEEQTQIAKFLDYETTKIDALIEKQQQLIALLKEKRQAVISHAVTKGLNLDAPMRDSGVEWLGEVPAHWEVTRAKYLFDFVTSGSRGWAEFYSDDGALFFRIANLTRDTIEPKLLSVQNVTPPHGSEGERSRIKEGDLLISITADLGSVCVADDTIGGGYVSQHVSLCRPNRRVESSRWLGYLVLSDVVKEQLLGSGYGGTKIQLSLEDIRELVLARPDTVEQEKIAKYLDARMAKFSSLIAVSEDQVELLQERRTALISAAVTGKIDVRGWKAPDSKAEVEVA